MKTDKIIGAITVLTGVCLFFYGLHASVQMESSGPAIGGFLFGCISCGCGVHLLKNE